MEDHSPRLILLPGLGTDARLFEPQRRAFERLEVPDWLPPERNESLADYARRMAEGIDATPRFYLGGMSLGGMVAFEMAKVLEPECVFLIASSTSTAYVPWQHRFNAWLLRWLPFNPLRRKSKLMRCSVPRLGARTPEQEKLAADMLRDADPAFMRWAVLAIVGWRPVGEPTCPVYCIHGSDDRLIPLRAVRAGRVVEGGGHLINLTHADEVNAFLAEHMRAG